MREKINITDYKLFLLSVKYLPILSALVLLIHAALVVFFHYDSIFENSFGISLVPACVVYLAQKAFKFCYIHKLLLWYCVFTDFCISLQNISLLYSTLIIGVVLFIIFIIHCIWNERITIFIEKTIRTDNN